MTEMDFFCFCGLWILDKAERISRKMERCGIAAEYDRLNAELERLMDSEFRELCAEAAAKGIELGVAEVFAWEKARRSGK